MELRQYQEQSLDVLESYLRLVANMVAGPAFYDVAKRSYRAAP